MSPEAEKAEHTGIGLKTCPGQENPKTLSLTPLPYDPSINLEGFRNGSDLGQGSDLPQCRRPRG